MWRDLEKIEKTMGEKKWIVSRNFNEVMAANKQDEQGTYSDTGPAEFREVVGKSQLMETQYMGGRWQRVEAMSKQDRLGSY